MSALGLTAAASELLEALRPFGWAFVADLVVNRSAGEVDRAIGELSRAGLAIVRTRRGRRAVELIGAGRASR